MINKEGKLFGKISIIDIAVVLAIAVAALGMYMRFFVGNEKVETASSHIEYKMKVQEVRIGTAKALENYQSAIYDSTTKEYLGDIVAVEYTNATKGVEMANGKMRETTVPERYDVIVTVRVDGKINSSGYYTATNQALAAGSSCLFNSKAAKTTGRVLEVYEVE
ncbi:MAG: DUF4330 domain-containing protein [Clostridia bacterium]|nr:DUF4330 domain-containing protein [Clostridia bacterium]